MKWFSEYLTNAFNTCLILKINIYFLFSFTILMVLCIYSLIFFTVQIYSPPSSPSNCSISHTSSCPQSLRGCPHSYPTSSPYSLSPQVSPGLGASSLSEARPSSPRSVCVGGFISAGVCCLVGGPVFGRSWGSRLIETAGPPTKLPSFSASSAFL